MIFIENQKKTNQKQHRKIRNRKDMSKQRKSNHIKIEYDNTKKTLQTKRNRRKNQQK